MFTFPVFLVVNISSFISHFGRQTIIWAFLAISKIIFHRTVVLVSIWIFDGSVYEFILLKSTLELCSILQLQISTTLGFIFEPLTIIYPTIKGKETCTLFLLVFPFAIVILFRWVYIVPIPTFQAIIPATFIHYLSYS